MTEDENDRRKRHIELTEKAVESSEKYAGGSIMNVKRLSCVMMTE